MKALLGLSTYVCTQQGVELVSDSNSVLMFSGHVFPEIIVPL